MGYAAWKKRKASDFQYMLKDIKAHRTCYLFLAPYALIFLTFIVAPVVVSIYYSFTDYNVFQAPSFVGFENYIHLLLGDEIFLQSIRVTLIIAGVTGPLGYLASFLFAWFIHELPRYLRAVVVLIFYAPTISGSLYMIWALVFSGDTYGYLNGFLLEIGAINQPIYWLTNADYVLPIILIVVLWMSLGTGFLSFVAGLQTVDKAQYEAGYVDGIRNRWQELWFITLPNMKGMLMFGAVMAITQSFGVADVTTALAGFPSTDYAAHTVVNHLVDYGSLRFEMGYATTIATVLFLTMIVCNNAIQKMLNRIGT